MYSFCAYFENLVTGEQISRVINVDMAVCDAEMLGGKSEMQVAWECAIFRALNMRSDVVDFVKIELKGFTSHFNKI